MKDEADDKVPVSEAARRIKNTPSALYLAINKGNLPYELSYGRVIVSMAEVRRYKAELKPANGRPKKKGKK